MCFVWALAVCFWLVSADLMPLITFGILLNQCLPLCLVSDQFCVSDQMQSCAILTRDNSDVLPGERQGLGREGGLRGEVVTWRSDLGLGHGGIDLHRKEEEERRGGSAERRRCLSQLCGFTRMQRPGGGKED